MVTTKTVIRKDPATGIPIIRQVVVPEPGGAAAPVTVAPAPTIEQIAAKKGGVLQAIGPGGVRTTVYPGEKKEAIVTEREAIVTEVDEKKIILPISPGVAKKIEEAGGLQEIFRQQYMMRLREEGKRVVKQAVEAAARGETPVVVTPEEEAIKARMVKEFEEYLTKAPPHERVFWGLGTMTTPSFVPLTVSVIGELTGIPTGYPQPETIVAEEAIRQKYLIREEQPIRTTFRRTWETAIEGIGFPFTAYFGAQAVGWGAHWAIPKVSTIVAKIPIAGAIAAKAGEFVVAHPKELFVATTAAVSVIEIKRLQELREMGVPLAGIAGYLAKDIATYFLIGKGFERGLKEGAPWRYWKKEYVPPEAIIEPEILYSEKAFPTTRESASELVREFYTSKYRLYQDRLGAWHATAEHFVPPIKYGEYGDPGLYISPSLSKHFLRISPGKTLVDYTRFTLGAEPQALSITVLGFKRIPASVRAKGFVAMNKWLAEQATKGYGYITPAFELGKTEKEALIPVGTKLIGETFEKFSKIDDIRFPIIEWTAVKDDAGVSMSEVFAEFTKSMARYYSYTEPYVTVESVLAPAVVSLISRTSEISVPSRVSAPSGVSIPSKVSRISISEPSKPISISQIKSTISQVSKSISPSIIPSSVSASVSPSISPSKVSVPSGVSIPSKVSVPSPSYYPPPPSYPPSPPYPPPLYLKYPSGRKVKKAKRFARYTTGYVTEIFKGGKWIKISKEVLPRQKAIKLGEKAVDVFSLAARFRIRPTKEAVLGVETPYDPSKKFRPYRIKKGRKIPLRDEWIEKAHFRLEPYRRTFEVPEIMEEKRQKTGFRKPAMVRFYPRGKRRRRTVSRFSPMKKRLISPEIIPKTKKVKKKFGRQPKMFGVKLSMADNAFSSVMPTFLKKKRRK